MRRQRTRAGRNDYIDGVALSADEKSLASASRDGTLRLWDLTTGKESEQLAGAEGTCTCVAFAPDGRELAAGNARGELLLWELPAGRLKRRVEIGTGRAEQVVYLRDGRTLAAGGSDFKSRIERVPDPIGEEFDAEETRLETVLFHRGLERIRQHFDPKTWQAFWRTAVDGLTAADAAAELGVQPGAVRVAKSRVLQRLRQQLGDLD